MSKGCTIALPTGKSLEASTLELLKQARINVDRPHARSIEGTVEGVSGLSRAIFCRPDQIGTLVARGVALFGITGKDMIIERPQKDIEICAELPYGRATLRGTRCVLFTHRDNPISTLEQLKHDRGSDMQRLGPLSVASEYPIETEAFFKANGMCLIVLPATSSEVLVYTRVCRYGVALVETGTTFAVNGLKEIKGGKLFDSCAVLIGNSRLLDANQDDVVAGSRRALARFLASLLMGTLEARTLVYLVMNAPTRNLDQIEKILPALKSPTVQRLADPDFCSIASVVPATEVSDLMLKLATYGVTGFVTLPPSTVM